MPTLDDIRRAGESDLRDILAKSDDYTRRVLRDALRRYGAVQNIPESVWQDIRSHVESKTVAALYLLMLNADDWTAGEIERQGVARKRLGSQGSAGYSLTAAGRATQMALKTTDTLRTRLDRAVTNARLGDRGDVGELTPEGIDDALDEVLTPERIETTATNETTGAMSAGQRGAGRRHEPGAGSDTIIDLVWKTEGDDRVCPRCSPLDGTTEDVWGLVYPEGPGEEAHPNCRCELIPRVRAKDAAEAD